MVERRRKVPKKLQRMAAVVDESFDERSERDADVGSG